MSEMESKLHKYRQKIDKLDSKILQLLGERISVVEKVGKLKAEYGSKGSIMRPGREATMLRDIVSRSNSSFPNGGIAQIWRIIIAGAINVEEDSKLAVFYQSDMCDCFWLAREYFGAFTPIEKFSSADSAINELTEGKVTIAIVPLWSENKKQWWQSPIFSSELDSPSVFVQLPFLKFFDEDTIPVVALGYVTPEETGDDKSLWVVNSELLGEFGKYDIDYNLLKENEHDNQSLVAINGFINKDNEFLSVAGARYIGSYATPMSF